MQKKTGKKISKGIHSTVSRRNKLRPADRSPVDNFLNKWNAFLKGKRVWFTVANSDPNQRNKKFIRVLGSELYGDYRKYRDKYSMWGGSNAG